MFSPNEKAEVLMQRGSNVVLIELSISEEGKPKITPLWRMNNVPGLGAELHSGVRFKDPRYMFLVDN